MTQPNFFSDVAAKPHLQPDPFDAGGAGKWVLATLPVAAATAAAQVGGLVRIYPGFRLNEFFVMNDDLDSGTTVTASIGWYYDTPTTAAVEDDDGLETSNTGLRTANNVISWPVDATNRGAAGINFVAQTFGYLIIKIIAGPTTTAGNVYFKYNADYRGL